MGFCRLRKRRRPAAPKSRMEENIQASRMALARGRHRGWLRGHLWAVGGTFRPHPPRRASMGPGSRGRRERDGGC